MKNIRIISDIPYLVGQSKVSKIDAEIGPEAELKDSSCLAVCPVIIKPHGCGTDQMFRFELLDEETNVGRGNE